MTVQEQERITGQLKRFAEGEEKEQIEVGETLPVFAAYLRGSRDAYNLAATMISRAS